jgi:hypothetical protein
MCPEAGSLVSFIICRSAVRAPRLLRRLAHVPLLLHIPLHFEAGLQIDITEDAVARAGVLVALGSCAARKLRPFRLKSVACLRLIGHAPFLLLLRAALEPALPRDIEFRQGARDRDGVQGSQNNDRQVNQHFCSPS